MFCRAYTASGPALGVFTLPFPAGKGWWAEFSTMHVPSEVFRVELDVSSQLGLRIKSVLIFLLKTMQIQPGTALMPIRFNLQCFPALIHLL